MQRRPLVLCLLLVSALAVLTVVAALKLVPKGDGVPADGEANEVTRTVSIEAIRGTWVGTNYDVQPPETLVLEIRGMTRRAGRYRFSFRFNSPSRREAGVGFARFTGMPRALEVCLSEQACAWLLADPPDGLRLVAQQGDAARDVAWELIKR